MGKHVGLSLVVIGLIFFLAWVWGGPTPPPEEETAPPVETEDTGGENESAVGPDEETMLRVLIDGELQEMDMATYLQWSGRRCPPPLLWRP